MHFVFRIIFTNLSGNILLTHYFPFVFHDSLSVTTASAQYARDKLIIPMSNSCDTGYLYQA